MLPTQLDLDFGIADINNIPALIIQTKNLYASSLLMMLDAEKIKVSVGKMGGNLYFLVYDEDEGIDEPILVDKATPTNVEFVRETNKGNTWLLCFQVTMISESEEDSKVTSVFVKNIGEGLSMYGDKVSVVQPYYKSKWLIDL